MKNKILVLMSLVLFSFSCKKDLNLNSNNIYGVKEFLNSKNCYALCGNIASCENKIVSLYGLIEEDNIIKENNKFSIVDTEDENFKIDVELEDSITNETLLLINTLIGQEIVVEALVKGFDANMNFSCERMIVLKLQETGKIEQY